MVELLTEKQPNGRQTLFVLIEPHEVDHIKRGQPLIVDTSRVYGYDILIGYVPDGVKAKQLIGRRMPLMDSTQFAQLMQELQMYPEIRRQMRPRSLRPQVNEPPDMPPPRKPRKQ